MFRRLIGPFIIAAVAALNIGAATGAHMSQDTGRWVTPTVIIDPSFPRCATEDSVMCVWVGPEQGNERGAVVINGTR